METSAPRYSASICDFSGFELPSSLDESPVAGKVSDARALEDERGEAEVEAADEGAVHPGEEQVTVVTLHGGQRKQAQSWG